MRFQNQVLLFIIASWFIVYEVALLGYLGPYGLPNDNLHLILLVAVLTFTFMIYVFVSQHQHTEVPEA